MGGSSGIGKALVEQYARSNYKVYATFNSNKPHKTDHTVSYIKFDLLDPESIRKTSKSFNGVEFDVFIYNAGKFEFKSTKGPVLDRQDWIESFVINSIAPIQLPFALQDRFIEKGGKYVVITSRRGSAATNIAEMIQRTINLRSMIDTGKFIDAEKNMKISW